MALIQCDECGKQISDKAKTCPDCGCPVDAQIVKEPDIDYSRYTAAALFDEAMKAEYSGSKEQLLRAEDMHRYILYHYKDSNVCECSKKQLSVVLDKLSSVINVNSSSSTDPSSQVIHRSTEIKHQNYSQSLTKDTTIKPSVITAIPIGLIAGSILGAFLAKIFMTHNMTDNSFQTWLFVAILIQCGTPLAFSLTKFRHKGFAAYVLIFISMNIGEYVGFIVSQIGV